MAAIAGHPSKGIQTQTNRLFIGSDTEIPEAVKLFMMYVTASVILNLSATQGLLCLERQMLTGP